MNNKQLATLVDGSGFIYRAFYASLNGISSPGDEESSVALHRFCVMLISLLHDHKSDFFCFAFDTGRKTFRVELYKEYKAHRKPMPEALKRQIPLMHEACDVFGIPTVQVAGFEADDIIATYSRIFSLNDIMTKIITVDKDLIQLLNDHTYIFNPVKSMEIRTQDVIRKYNILPQQMTSFQALAGDKSDNIPGVPGIGPVTAAKLVREYGSLFGIYDNIHNLSPEKIRNKLIEYKSYAELSLKLATLYCNVDTIEHFSNLKINYNHDKAICFLERCGFNHLIKRLKKLNLQNNDFNSNNLFK